MIWTKEGTPSDRDDTASRTTEPSILIAFDKFNNEDCMYTARHVLKLWGKADQADQRRLKLKYFSGLSEKKFKDDFVSFLAREFKLQEHEDIKQSQKKQHPEL